MFDTRNIVNGKINNGTRDGTGNHHADKNSYPFKIMKRGDCASLYGVKPDLLILGKVLGGGMPVAAVAGRRDVMDLCTRRTARVKFEGGTYSAHELSLLAARSQLRHVREHEAEVYGRLSALGASIRRRLADADHLG